MFCFAAPFYSPGSGVKGEEGWESVWGQNQGSCRKWVSIPTPSWGHPAWLPSLKLNPRFQPGQQQCWASRLRVSDWFVPFWFCLTPRGLNYFLAVGRIRRDALFPAEDEHRYHICPSPGGHLREGKRISAFHSSILFFVPVFVGEIN